MQATCGNCGQPVEGSDITCPHCGVLLAAYASPAGLSPADTGEWSLPAYDAARPAAREDPAPAAEIDGLDYAQPPSQAEPHPVLQQADPELVTDSPAPLHGAEPDGPEPVGEVALHEKRQADVALTMRLGFRQQAAISNYDETKRSNIEAHLRKLHAEIGSESSETRLTKPVDDFITPPKERSIIEAFFSWTDKEESMTIIGVTFAVSMVVAIVLEATKVVDFPLSGLFAVLFFVGGPVLSAIKHLDS